MIDKPISFYKLMKENAVVIPIIQRDYAQGRENEKVNKIRAKFLDALFHAIANENEPVELDFLYGYNNQNSEERSNFIPLDGQQRLTTLFLLHWYVALKENKQDEAKLILKDFTYEVRHSSKVFCGELINFSPKNLNSDIKKTIENQSWFFSEWKNDPTIAAMLVMLSDLQIRYETLKEKNVWEKLTADNPPIKFYCLPMEKLGLVDNLYIKMNSRGKPLTNFEHFKSNFVMLLNSELQDEFNKKIDKEWSDFFWNVYANKDVDEDLAEMMDEGVLNFLHYITDILVSKNEIAIANKAELLEKATAVFENKEENIKYLFNRLNDLSNLENHDEYFKNFFYKEEDHFQISKTRLFFRSNTTNLLTACIEGYRKSTFSFGERLMLYAVIIHLQYKTDDFNNRIRILRNLIANSESEMRQDLYKNLLDSTEHLIKEGVIPDYSRFNAKQKREELEKQDFLEKEKLVKELLYRLEDHQLLRGNLALFDLNEDFKKRAKSFQNIFRQGCSFPTISKALMTFGDYSQKNSNGQVMFYGNNKADDWRTIFTPSRDIVFGGTKSAMDALLATYQQSNLESIIQNYLDSFEKNKNKPKSFNYYYIKYREFHFEHWQKGYYVGEKAESSRYEFYKMNKRQFNGMHWSPFLIALKNLNSKTQIDDYNWKKPLELKVKYATFKFWCEEEGFHIEINNGKNALKLFNLLVEKGWIEEYEEEGVGIFEIKQNDEKIDIEDRILRGKELIDFIIKCAK